MCEEWICGCSVIVKLYDFADDQFDQDNFEPKRSVIFKQISL